MVCSASTDNVVVGGTCDILKTDATGGLPDALLTWPQSLARPVTVSGILSLLNPIT